VACEKGDTYLENGTEYIGHCQSVWDWVGYSGRHLTSTLILGKWSREGYANGRCANRCKEIQKTFEIAETFETLHFDRSVMRAQIR
jgi:hypothetical protein